MLNEPPSLIRIVAIVFPVFAIAFLGWAYGRRHQVDLGEPNRLNLDIFIPALVFSSLADKSFDFGGHRALALGSFLMIVGSGLIGWAVAALARIPYKILVPATMFNNCGNLGLPVAALAFGQEGLAGAVVMFLVFNLVQFSFGIWLLDHRAKWWNLWRSPVIIAAFAGLGMSFTGLALWPPLQSAIKMLGDVSIPMALFALGVRIASSHVTSWRVGFIGALVRPASGILVTWLIAMLLGLEGQQKALLIIFGALPPAMLNYVFAERYRQGPDEVATIVMVGNLAAVLILPLVLAVVL